MKTNAVIDRRFDRRGRLPGQVFRGSENLGYLLTDSALITAPECWRILTVLARRFGDQAIIADVVEDLWDRDHCPPLQAFETAANDSSDAFAAWLRVAQGGRTEPLYVDARIIAITGGSGSWGLWFDQDKELAVLGIPLSQLGAVREDLAAESEWPWHQVADVAELLGPAFEPRPVPETLLRELRRSYASVRVG